VQLGSLIILIKILIKSLKNNHFLEYARNGPVLPIRIDNQQELSAVVVFDFGIIRGKYEGVHQWLARRWNAFSIGMTSAVGLLLSFAIGPWVFSISLERKWWAPVGFLVLVCVYVACCAWRDGRRMVYFMAQMPNALLTPNAADNRHQNR